MSIRNQELIKKYIDKKSSFLCEEWYDMDIIENDRACLCVLNDVWWEGGYERFCLPSEKEKFYRITQQALDILLEYARSLGEKICCIGPFHCYENFEHWSNKEDFDCFNELKEHIKNDEYIILNMESNKELLGLIIENGFRYLSCVCVYLPKNDILIEPDNHTQLFVYSNDLESLKEGLNKVVVPKGWRVVG